MRGKQARELPARRLRRVAVLTVLGLGLAGANRARADASADKRKQVEALYTAAMKDVAAKDFHSGCPKLEQAYALDATAINVLAKLADCYASGDELASAHDAYGRLHDAASATHDKKYDETITFATKRSAELEAKAPRVELAASGELSAAIASGETTVTLDGVEVPIARIGTPWLIDAGEHVVAVTARTHAAWSQRFTATDGATQQVNLSWGASAEHVADPPPAVEGTSFWSGGRVAGLVVGILGLGGMGAGIGVGFASKGYLDDSNKNGCNATTNACNPAGTALRNKAVTFAHVGTGTFFGGLGLAAVGTLIFALSPSKHVTAVVSPTAVGLEARF